MSSFLPRRRSGSRLTLKTRSTDPDGTDDLLGEEGRDPFTPWPVAALIAGLGSALFGWILICGVVVLGWLTARTDALIGAMRTGTHFWLLSNGAGLSLQGERWTLMPLAVTLVLVLMISGMAGFAVRQALLAARGDGPELGRTEVGRCVRNITISVTLSYMVAVTITASIVGTSNQGGRALVGSALIALVSSWWGASRAAGYRVVDALPVWLRAVPGAVQLALLTMMIAGAAVFAAGVIVRFDQINELAAGLGLNVFSGLFVLLVQAIFLPNLILWSGSWALGAGFGVGAGSVVSPTNTDLGLQPWIPIFGALPDEGPGSLWSLLWLLSGVLAGALAAAWVMRVRPRARFDETALVGGLSGVLAGLVFTALAAISGGDLGNGRLAGMGPRLTELGVMAGAVMGISGLATGLIWGLLRRPRAVSADSDTDSDTDSDSDTVDRADSDTATAIGTTGAERGSDDEDTAIVDQAPQSGPDSDSGPNSESDAEATPGDNEGADRGTESDEPTRDLAKLDEDRASGGPRESDTEDTHEVTRTSDSNDDDEEAVGDDEETVVVDDKDPVVDDKDPVVDDEDTVVVDDEETVVVEDQISDQTGSAQEGPTR